MDNLPRGVNKTALMIYLVVEGENEKCVIIGGYVTTHIDI